MKRERSNKAPTTLRRYLEKISLPNQEVQEMGVEIEDPKMARAGGIPLDDKSTKVTKAKPSQQTSS
jgi:hypothetical protein